MTGDRALYLGTGVDAAFAMFHPVPDPDPAVGVVFCPPFGWDETASHRGLRDWAVAVADSGCPALRIDFPGTGDAGGSPWDPGRLDAWTQAAARAARWLRAESGCGRVAAVGLGVGGLAAFRAAALEPGIDDLVLWAVPARGRALVREMKAFARLNADVSAALAAETSPPQDGSLETGGFVVSAETLEALNGLDLTAMALPRPTQRRALLLERDGMAPDERLREHLEQAGLAVDVAPGDGYALLTAGPQESQYPAGTVAATVAWLGSASPAAEPHEPGDVPRAQTHLELEVSGRRIRERPFVVDQPGGRLHGVLSEPVDGAEDGVRGLLLNAGTVRRTGPSRLWVEFARSWAARGVRTLRLDVEGIGDSDGRRESAEDAALYTPQLVDHAVAALDALDASLGPQTRSRYLVAGLCSGAYWGYHSALRDDRVRCVLMLNPRALYWHESLAVARIARKTVRSGGGHYWNKMLRGGVSAARMRALAVWLLRAPVEVARVARQRRRLRADFDRMRDESKRMWLIFGEDEPLDEELTRDGVLAQLDRWPNIELERLPGQDHILRPIHTQERVHALVERALEGELAVRGQPGASAPAGLRAT